MKQISFIFLLTICFSLTFCKKSKDSVSTHNINGQVYNLCTDSGLANVTVHLNINDPSGGHSITTTSSANGNFTFNNVQIHSSSDYNYQVNVLANGAGGYQPAIDGDYFQLNKSNIGQNIKLSVTPHFKKWNIYFPNGIAVTTNDTFVLTLRQNIFHKNVSNSNWQLINNFPPPPLSQYPANWISALDNYWMGWWQVTYDKTKNGVHIIKTDSFYVGWGATVSDTIPW